MTGQGLLKWVQRQRFQLTETAERILHVAHIDVSLTLDESLNKGDAEGILRGKMSKNIKVE